MAFPGELHTITYEERDNVAWITLNRPEVHNAFNEQMQRELQRVWRGLRRVDSVRAVVLTGAGDRAFCTGVDRTEAAEQRMLPEAPGENRPNSWGSTPFMFSDAKEWLSPKTNGLWKPVIAAVNGMACGGAFYLLGEADIILAAEHATFFDPHVTYGITMAYESAMMRPKLPLHEVLRMSLLGNWERMTAQRALQVGLVTEVVPLSELSERAAWWPMPSRQRHRRRFRRHSARCGPPRNCPGRRHWSRPGPFPRSATTRTRWTEATHYSKTSHASSTGCASRNPAIPSLSGKFLSRSCFRFSLMN